MLMRNGFDENIAERRSDGDAIDAHALATDGGIIAGRVAEFIGHAQINFSQQILKSRNA